MYLLHLYYENTRLNGSGELCLEKSGNDIAKWSLFSGEPSGLELLQLIAAACAGTSLVSRLPFALQELCGNPHSHLHVEFLLAIHPPDEFTPRGSTLFGSGVKMDGKGALEALKKNEFGFVPVHVRRSKAKTGLTKASPFFLAYGPKFEYHDRTDDFDFADPFFRITRIHSIFSDGARLTDPVEFLTRVHYRGIRSKRLASRHIIERLCRLFKEHLSVDTRSWTEKECDLKQEWKSLLEWQQRAILPIVDAARHLLSGYQKYPSPLDLPGFVLLDRPDMFCSEELFPRWLMLMDEVFPQMQFIITVPDHLRRCFPEELLAKSCSVPMAPEPIITEPVRIPSGTVLLLDVDSRLPNLALMKLSRYFKEKGKSVVLGRRQAMLPGVEAVYASAVFSTPSTVDLLWKLRKYYGDALIVGGSGTDVRRRLPEEIERMPADYSLYPELGNRAIGFITRGCPFSCPFCIVPQKEGKNRQVATLDDLLTEGQRKLLLLDDNILAHPRSGELLQEMADRGLMVNFTQTLDLRLLDEEKAAILKRIHCSNLRFTRRVYHFSLNDNRGLDAVRHQYEMFGFNTKDNVEFICMYGFNTTLAEDVERFRFLRSLPGAYVFVQEYRPIPGGPPPNMANFFGDDADELIDQLIQICFPQNMKSMERYYRWVSKHYAKTFDRLHIGLVDTIFRYNNRQNRGLYLATMAGLRLERR